MKVSVQIKMGKNPGKVIKELMRLALDKPTLDEIGRQAIELNKKGLRRGILPDGSDIPEISETWIKRRSRLRKFNKTGPSFSPKRSNLTFSGQLINAIFFKSKPSQMSHFISSKPSNAEIDLYVLDTTRAPYTNLDGKPSSSKQPTNKKLAEYIAQKGIVFVGLTENARKRANRILMAKLRQLLRSLK